MELSRRQLLGTATVGAASLSTGLLLPATAGAATRPTLKLGSTGSHVKYLQDVLKTHRFWLKDIDGSYDIDTQQAVMAFQKHKGLGRDGVCGPQTWSRLSSISRPWVKNTSGSFIEIRLSAQLLYTGMGNKASWVYNTSTGSNQYYTVEGKRYKAVTPTGHFSIIREINGMRTSRLGQLWRPKYFTTTGIAIHGSTSIPGYPASHGCCRVSNMAIDHIWSNREAPIGRKVWVY